MLFLYGSKTVFLIFIGVPFNQTKQHMGRQFILIRLIQISLSLTLFLLKMLLGMTVVVAISSYLILSILLGLYFCVIQLNKMEEPYT